MSLWNYLKVMNQRQVHAYVHAEGGLQLGGKGQEQCYELTRVRVATEK